MNFFQDRQIRRYCLFLLLFSLLLFCFGGCFCLYQTNTAKNIYLAHDQALASALLKQGVSETVVADALTSSSSTPEGTALLNKIGIGESSGSWFFPYLNHFLPDSLLLWTLASVCMILLLFLAAFLFFCRRRRLYLDAERIVRDYTDGDFSLHLPQNQEGELFRLFSAVEQLATILQSKNEAEARSKTFLKNTISDISHQLKTPLAALMMYQEILSDEPDNIQTVRTFSAKIGATLNRMERLILSMLQIARLDAGNIIFEKNSLRIADLVARSMADLTERARLEGKKLLTEGDSDMLLDCDPVWTVQAIGNILKNALDHTETGGIIRIFWERTPAMTKLVIQDDGSGIAPEDLHHIFKRFYRSSHSLDKEGVGLGLPLAKSIIEGQGGLISVQSAPGKGTAFTLSFLTKP